jgi:hypothetical protein
MFEKKYLLDISAKFPEKIYLITPLFAMVELLFPIGPVAYLCSESLQ